MIRTTLYDKPVIIGIATFGKDRRKALASVMEILTPQCDSIILYDNRIYPDITDLGKFQGLYNVNEPVYYLTCDDDLVYPSTYVDDVVKAINKHKTIVTHHGRLLQALDRSYYWGHKNYRCLSEIKNDEVIDIAGTGVTGWDTSYFNPISILYSRNMRMADLVFSLRAAEDGKKITVLKHSVGYIKHQPIDLKLTIANQEGRKENILHQQIANKIYRLNHG